MAVITPRDGLSLAQVVQAALNVAGSAHVSIVSGGTTSGVQLPDHHVSAVEIALGWSTAPQPSSPAPPAAPTEDVGESLPPASVKASPPTSPKKPIRRARRSEKE